MDRLNLISLKFWSLSSFITMTSLVEVQFIFPVWMLMKCAAYEHRWTSATCLSPSINYVRRYMHNFWSICRLGILCVMFWFFKCRSVIGNSVQDHLSYYGVEFPTDDPATCWIVMDPLLVEYGSIDSKGNVKLFRDPATPIPQMQALEAKWIGDSSVR